MKKKHILFFAVITALVLTGCKKDEVVKESSTSTSVIEIDGNSSVTDERKATLEVTLTEIEEYKKLGVVLGVQLKIAPNTLLEKMHVDVFGNAQFDVTKYIGKTLSVEPIQEKIEIFPVEGSLRSLKIHEGQNSLSIGLPDPQRYKARIEVLDGTEPVKDVKVYAVSFLNRPALDLITLSGSKPLFPFPFAITNQKGIAEFPHLDATEGTEYYFVVVTEEPSSLSKGKYSKVLLTLDDIWKKGTIKLPQSSIQINFESLEDLSGMKVKLYGKSNLTDLKYTEFVGLQESFVLFPEVAPGKYYFSAGEKSGCLYVSQNGAGIEVKKGEDFYSETIKIVKGGTLRLRCASSNPYTVSIVDSKNKYWNFEMDGKTTERIKLPEGVAQIKIKQKSGYMIYPTKEDFNVKIKCGEVSICFPSDKCD